ncbi:MAG: SGNH/GDSL hydrolase family protein [Pseudomonadota bacterium]
MQQRVTLFAKGNVDLRDTLVAHRAGGGVVWNGINEAIRARGIPATVRVRHETHSRFDALLAADGKVPAMLAERALPLAAYPPASQFSRAVFDAQADAFVFSIQADLYTVMFRHAQEGFLLHAREWQSWSEDDREWLRQHFVPSGLLEPAQAMASLGRIVERLRESTQAPVLVYNVSAVMPGDSIHCHLGLGETIGARAQRFNLELVELSRRTGISIIDVDQIVARGGSDRLKLAQLHLNAAGCEAVAHEVVRVLADLDVLPAAPRQ